MIFCRGQEGFFLDSITVIDFCEPLPDSFAFDFEWAKGSGDFSY